MKFPYGISDFYQIVKEDCFYVDRTNCLSQLEGAYQVGGNYRSSRIVKSGDPVLDLTIHHERENPAPK